MEEQWRHELAFLEPLLSNTPFDIVVCCYLIKKEVEATEGKDIEEVINTESEDWVCDEKSVPYPDLDVEKVFQNFLLVKKEEIMHWIPRIETQVDFIKACYFLINNEKLDEEKEDQSHTITQEEEDEIQEESDVAPSPTIKEIYPSQKSHTSEMKSSIKPRGTKVLKVESTKKKRKRDGMNGIQKEAECPPLTMDMIAGLEFSLQEDGSTKFNMSTLLNLSTALESVFGIEQGIERLSIEKTHVFLHGKYYGSLTRERFSLMYAKMKLLNEIQKESV